MVEVNKITGDIVKEAAGLMKAGKADVSGGFTSDAILNGPDILFEQLGMIFRSWCVHGTVTRSLLACAFLPLLKSALKDPADVTAIELLLKVPLSSNFLKKWSCFCGVTSSLQIHFSLATR